MKDWPVLGILALACSAALAAPTSPAAEVDYDLYFLVRNGKCPEAARVLNEQLKKPHAELLLFTGAMYENGACLKRDWGRAVSYYVRASELGSKAARMRLAAGYYDPINGVDLASALWWAHQGAAPMPKSCWVTGFSPTMEPTSFVDAIQKWPAGMASACAYVAAVMGGTLSDPYYPGLARVNGEEGIVQLWYQPSEGRFVAQLVESSSARVIEERRWRAGDAADGKTDLLGYAHDTSLQAVRRYREAPTIDPTWTVRFEWNFKFVR